VDYIIVNDADGAIIGTVSTNVRYAPDVPGVSSETHYWDDAEEAFALRAEMPVVVEGTRITGIPSEGTVTIAGPIEYSGPIIVPEMNFVFDLVGTYMVTLSPTDPKWLDTIIEMVVSE
jgi:hypothetical protein